VITLIAWIGILQEGSAEKAANALKAMLSSDAEVMRDGKATQVPAQNIVPGDIVIVKLGDRIPADIRMVDVSNLACRCRRRDLALVNNVESKKTAVLEQIGRVSMVIAIL